MLMSYANITTLLTIVDRHYNYRLYIIAQGEDNKISSFPCNNVRLLLCKDKEFLYTNGNELNYFYTFINRCS